VTSCILAQTEILF